MRFALLTVMLLLAFGAPVLAGPGDNNGHTVKRTADDIHVPEPRRYGRATGAGRYTDRNFQDRQLYPPEVHLYRSQLAKKAQAHYNDGVAASRVECANPWPAIIKAIQAIKAEIEKELAFEEGLVSKYKGEREKAQKQHDTLEKELRFKGYPGDYDNSSEANATRKKFGTMRKAEADAREFGLWVVGMEEGIVRWKKDLKQVEGNLKAAQQANASWKKPAHCTDSKDEPQIQIDPNILKNKWLMEGGMTELDPPTLDLEDKPAGGNKKPAADDKPAGKDDGWNLGGYWDGFKDRFGLGYKWKYDEDTGDKTPTDEEDGEIKLDPLQLKYKLDFGGGMTKIDPPKFFKLSVKTRCVPCQVYADDYNTIVTLYNELRMMEGSTKYALEQLQKQKPQKNKGGLKGLDAAGDALKKIMEQERREKFLEQQIAKIQKQIEATEKDLQEAGQRLAKCEQQCAPKLRTSGIAIGTGGSASQGSDPLALPFKWEGPYTTSCPERCQKITDTLNGLPEKARKILLRIRQLTLANRLAELNDQLHELSLIDYQAEIKQNNAEIARHKKNLETLKDYFKKLLKAKADCEKKYCKPKPKDKKVGYIPSPAGESQNISVAGGDIEIELEDAISVAGNNAFNAKDVEQVGARPTDHATHTPSPSRPPVRAGGNTPPPVKEPAPAISMGEDPSGLIEKPITAFNPFFNTPGEALIHIMFSSKCPDKLGKPVITTPDNRTVKAEVVSTHQVLNTKVEDNNSASPKVDVQFNCNVPSTGSYSETVRVKVTDPATGESKMLNYNASVTVKK